MSWIKMRGSLLGNYKVGRIVHLLADDKDFCRWFMRGDGDVIRDGSIDARDDAVLSRVTVGGLVALWSQVNEVAGAEGFLRGATLESVDHMSGIPGLAQAMIMVGWLEEKDGGMLFPNFAEYNIPEKTRSATAKSGAQRMAELRERRAAEAAEAALKKDGDNSDAQNDGVTSHSDRREDKRREEKKERKQRVKTDAQSPAFDAFWAAYPKKESKLRALESWNRINPDDALAEQIMAGLAKWKQHPQWTKDNGQFVNQPTSWLNQRKWEDEIGGSAGQSGGDQFKGAL